MFTIVTNRIVYNFDQYTCTGEGSRVEADPDREQDDGYRDTTTPWDRDDRTKRRTHTVTGEQL